MLILGTKAPTPEPPLVTTSVTLSHIKSVYSNHLNGPWRSLDIDTLNYKTCSVLFRSDTQLCWELISGLSKVHQKSLGFPIPLDTKPTIMLFTRWYENGFYKKLIAFMRALPNIENKIRISAGDDELRLPSRQWLQWIIWVLLRQTTILAKVKLECEKTIHFWLALISTSQSQSQYANITKDSILISNITARIWYLSTVMVEELHSKIYPFLLQLIAVTEPDPASPQWTPDSDPGITGRSLLDWLVKASHEPYWPASKNEQLSAIMQNDNAWILRVLPCPDIENANREQQGPGPGSKLAEDLGESRGKASTTKDGIKIKVEPTEPQVPVPPENNEKTWDDDSDSDPGIDIFPNVQIKTEPDEDPVQVQTIDTSDSERSDEEYVETNCDEIEDENPASDESDPEDNGQKSDSKLATDSDAEDQIAEDSDRSSVFGQEENGDEGPSPAKIMRRIKTEVVSADEDGGKERAEVPERKDYKLPPVIKGLRHFRQYWELFFSECKEVTKTGNRLEELLHQIKDFKASPKTLFSSYYWSMFRDYKGFIVRLEIAVKLCRPGLDSMNRLRVQFKEIEEEVEVRLEKQKQANLSKAQAKVERKAKKKAKYEARMKAQRATKIKAKREAWEKKIRNRSWTPKPSQ